MDKHSFTPTRLQIKTGSVWPCGFWKEFVHNCKWFYMQIPKQIVTQFGFFCYEICNPLCRIHDQWSMVSNWTTVEHRHPICFQLSHSKDSRKDISCQNRFIHLSGHFSPWTEYFEDTSFSQSIGGFWWNLVEISSVASDEKPLRELSNGCTE